MVAEKIIAACVLALFAHGAFRSLLVYGIHADVMSNSKLGVPFLVLGIGFIVLAVPWMCQIFGLLKNWKFTTIVLIATLVIGLPAWGYVTFIVK